MVETTISRQRREQLRSPHKAKARRAVYKAVKSGRIVKPETCQWCGSLERLEGHHTDYSEPLKVAWLCDGCHQIADSILRGRLEPEWEQRIKDGNAQLGLPFAYADALEDGIKPKPAIP